jgi:hypothetical protein
MQSGYDPHYMQFYHGKEPVGILMFNQDTLIQKQTDKIVRVNLCHISSSKSEVEFIELINKALEFIFYKEMHCSVVRL